MPPDVLFAVAGNPMHADPDIAKSTRPTMIVAQLQDATGHARDRIDAVRQNPHLSPAGKAAEIEKVGDALLVQSIKAGRELDAMATGIQARVTQALAPPKIEPTNAVEYLADRERREYVQGLTGPKRADVLAAVHRGEADDLAMALLRSPVPVGPDELQISTDRWERRCRAADPGLFEALDAGTRSREWGVRVHAFQQAAINTLTKPDAARMQRVTSILKD